MRWSGNARGIHCEITSGPVKARPTRRELQNELESLRRFVEAPARDRMTTVPPVATGISPPLSSQEHIAGSTLQQSPGALSQSTVERRTVPTFPGEHSNTETGNETLDSTSVVIIDDHLTAAQTLEDLEVSSEAIDTCFEMLVEMTVRF